MRHVSYRKILLKKFLWTISRRNLDTRLFRINFKLFFIFSVFFNPANSAPEIMLDLGEKINILCPSQKTKHYSTPPIFQIQMVDKSTFESCDLEPSKIQKIIYSCDQPFDQKKLTLHFLQVSPIYDAPTFNPGQTYYFTTSKKKLCENGLKLKVHVRLGE